MSKNNLFRYRRIQPQRQRFALRKLTVGVASVLLGTTFLVGAAQADAPASNASDSDTATAPASATPTNQPTADETASTTASLVMP